MRYSAQIVEDPSLPKKEQAIRLMCMSDTHGHHADIPKSQLFTSDFLLFCGDFTILGSPNDVFSFKKWLETIPSKHKIIIPGNLDLTFDEKNLAHFLEKILSNCSTSTVPIENVKKEFLANSTFHYLENDLIEIDGLRIFGSPFTGEFMDWAFQFREDDEEGQKKWEKLRNCGETIDIVMTHGPPKGTCDKTKSGVESGDARLREAIEKVGPSLHIYGHIHEAHGCGKINETMCCNVAVVDTNRVVVNAPTYIDLIPK